MMTFFHSLVILLLAVSSSAQNTACVIGDATTITARNGAEFSLRLGADVERGELNVEVTYDSVGWISFGVNNIPFMVPGIAVIGLPDSPTAPVALYNMNGYTQSAIIPFDDELQVVSNTRLEQNETHTTLAFTKPLEGDGLFPIALEGTTDFLFAGGSSNQFGFHAAFTPASLQVVECGEELGEAIVIAPDENLWKFHGYIMAVSWGILIPLGIGASVLRNLFPTGLFLRIHQVINLLAVAGTVAGFAIAVYNINEEGGKHFEFPHMKAGLAVFILSLVQAAGGFARPHLPHKPEDGGSMPPKSKIRSLWEYKHRIMGLATLGTAWYACHSGIEIFAFKFVQDDEELVTFWSVVGAITGAMFLLSLALKIKGRQDK